MTVSEWALLGGVILGGGGVAALVTAWVTHKRNLPDITKTNIETALRLRDEAVEEYGSIEQKLQQARKLLNEVQAELDFSKKYIGYLGELLDENGIEHLSAKDYSSAHKTA